MTRRHPHTSTLMIAHTTSAGARVFLAFRTAAEMICELGLLDHLTQRIDYRDTPTRREALRCFESKLLEKHLAR